MFALVLALTLLQPHAAVTTTLEKGATHSYGIELRRGESADVTVTQQGVDVVVEVLSPDGTLLDAVDGPTGRTGDERAEILAERSGTYAIRIRPYDANEPAAPYRIAFELRSAAATRALLRERQAARDEASAWLRARSARLDAPLPAVITAARIVGLGEATHGSREFADMRLALTRRLIEEHGFRVVALESSVDGANDGWIGRRGMRELAAFVAAWNAAHPSDRVRIAGVDPQRNAASRAVIDAFVRAHYEPAIVEQWNAARGELAAADEQTLVFGDSNVTPQVRQFLLELVARITLDAPLLPDSDRALAAIRTLAEFADFNSSGGRSRDWYMAARVMQAAREGRTVYWAHNAHVAARGSAAGALLRKQLGCGYAPVALTFGDGAFVAQMPNDLQDRLAVSRLPNPMPDSIENVLAGEETILAAWPCGTSGAPAWLQTPRPMHWVGALWTPGSLPATAYRPFDLLHDFDGVLFIPHVTADEIPSHLPIVPARVRPPAP